MWLYQDDNVNDKVVRTFASQVMNADDSWHECTDTEKQEWEETWRREEAERVAAEEEFARKIRDAQVEDTQAEVVE